jgi:hypothetical protein
LEGKEKDGKTLNVHLGGFSNAHMSSIKDEIPIHRWVTTGPLLLPNERQQGILVELDLSTFIERVNANKEYSLMSPNNHVHEYMRKLCASFSATIK